MLHNAQYIPESVHVTVSFVALAVKKAFWGNSFVQKSEKYRNSHYFFSIQQSLPVEKFTVCAQSLSLLIPMRGTDTIPSDVILYAFSY